MHRKILMPVVNINAPSADVNQTEERILPRVSTFVPCENKSQQ